MRKVVRYACLAAIVGLSVPAFVNVISVHQADASSYNVRSVPTTIDLNDSTDSEIISYYAGLPNSSSEKQGTNLLKNLKPILKNNQKYFSYGSSATTAVWQAYEIVDRDWVKSPASAISGYNSSTKIITGYTYGSGMSAKGTNPYIHALYVNRNVENQQRAWDDHNQNQWGINQEHIWAKSCGFHATSPSAGARGDLMHLWAGNGKVNGSYHSNYYYGYVDKTKSYDDPAVKDNMPNLSGNLMGKSKTFPSSTYSVFEPQDSDKGDIARAIFYMVARYNNYGGSDSDGFDSGNPNLELVNALNWKGPTDTSYTSSASKKGQMGILQDLLEWNRIDPPDQWEIHRNNILYKNFTENRNPFIDFPEWAEYIWGKSEDGSYSSNPTGSANTGSDVINGFSDDDTPAVKHVSVSPTVLNLEAGNSSTLTATVTVTNGASTDVTWTSSNTSVATVTSNGQVTAVADGSATITVRSVFDTDKYATCSVTVGSVEPEPTPKNIAWTRSGTTDTVTSGYTFSAVSGSSKSGYYQDASGTGLDLRIKKDSGNIWDNAPSSVSLTVKVGGGSEKDPLDNNVFATYIDSNGDEISSSKTLITSKSESQTGKEYTIEMPATNNVAGVKVTHAKETGFNVRIFGASLSIADDSKTLTSIDLDIENAKTEFDVGDTFEYDGLIVTANYDDDTSETVTPTSVSTPDLTTAGTKEVTVTYTENEVTKTATYDITVSVAPTSVSISPDGGTIDVGDTLQLTATVLPANAPDKSVTWSSSDEDVATISDSGLVTGISEGTATIYATTINDKMASCTITVQNSEPGTETFEGSVTANEGAFEGWTSDGLGTAYSDGSAKFDGSGDNVYNYSLFAGLVSTNMVSLTVTINGKINGTPVEANAYKVDAVDKNGNVLQTLTLTGADVVTTSYGNTVFSFNSGLTNCAGLKITYATKGSGNWGIKTISYAATYSTGSGPIASITASVDKDYHPGETISSSDVTVTANTGAVISTFTLVGDGYMFTYSDAPSGGTTKTKTFTVTATPEEEELSCTLTVNVSRVNHADRPTSTFALSSSNNDFDGLTSSYQTGQTLTKGGITFDVDGYVYSHKLSFNQSYYVQTGKLKNRTPINTGIANVSVAGASPKLKISLSTTGGDDDDEWVDLASKQSDVTYKYFKLHFTDTAATGYYNITSITITYRNSETATNVSNYIMYEDTPGQCESKFDIASGYFNAMSVAERATFMTSQDYVIASARERFEDWARHLGKTIEVENNDYVIKVVKPVIHIFNNEAHDNVSLIVIISIMGIGAIAGYFYFRKKKYQ